MAYCFGDAPPVYIQDINIHIINHGTTAIDLQFQYEDSGVLGTPIAMDLTTLIYPFEIGWVRIRVDPFYNYTSGYWDEDHPGDVFEIITAPYLSTGVKEITYTPITHYEMLSADGLHSVVAYS